MRLSQAENFVQELALWCHSRRDAFIIITRYVTLPHRGIPKVRELMALETNPDVLALKRKAQRCFRHWEIGIYFVSVFEEFILRDTALTF